VNFVDEELGALDGNWVAEYRRSDERVNCAVRRDIGQVIIPGDEVDSVIEPV